MARESSPECLPNGTVLRNYRILRPLGRGGVGITYLAEQIQQEGDIAFSGEESNLFVIKENLPVEYAVRKQNSHEVISRGEEKIFQWSLKTFIKEARTLATLQHSRIVRVLDAFEENGTAYFVMPWVDGSNLSSYPTPRNEEEAKKLQELLPPLLDALSYIHSYGILHRDITPDNILLTKEGKPVLIDFGAARSSIIASHTNTWIGTPCYCPPEQMSVNGDPKSQADIYALGATFYFLITGVAPEVSTMRLLASYDGKPDPLPALFGQSRLKKLYPENFLKGIDRALKIASRDRWESAAAWRNSLTTSSFGGKALLVCLLLLLLGGGWYGYQMISAPLQPAAELAAKEAAEKAAAEKAAILALFSRGISSSEYGSKMTGAARNGDTELVRLLLTAGADVNAADSYGLTPLLMAAMYGHAEVVRMLLAAPGIEVNKADRLRGWTPLIWAAMYGHAEVVRMLLAAPGIEVNKAGKDGKTPLDWAETEEIKSLLRAAGGKTKSELSR